MIDLCGDAQSKNDDAYRRASFRHDGIPSLDAAPIYLICGIQMLSLGVIGEYVGKIYMETKQRPRFMLDEVTWTAASPTPGDTGPVLGKARNAA